MNCLHYDMMEGKKIIQRMFILHRLRKENNMRKNIQVKVKVPQFTVITGLTYAQRDSWFGHTMQDLKMDLIYPEDKERKYPCIVWICGGAWLQMDRSAHLGYLRAHAGRFHIDPEKIGVMGESAGGYLTCMAALAMDPSFDVGENLEYSSSVQAACPWYPPTDFRGFPYDSAEQCAAAPESLLLGKNVMRHAGEALKCCPVSFVTPEAPPFLIIHGKDDHTVPFTQSELLYEKLEKAGCDVTLLAIEGADHADLHFFQEKIWEEIGDFFRKSLGNVR